MTTILESLVDHSISVITVDGRFFVGSLKGFDQSTNVVLSGCVERVFSEDSGVEFVQLGLYLIRGDNITIVGEMDEEIDRRLDFSSIRAQPLQPLSREQVYKNPNFKTLLIDYGRDIVYRNDHNPRHFASFKRWTPHSNRHSFRTLLEALENPLNSNGVLVRIEEPFRREFEPYMIPKTKHYDSYFWDTRRVFAWFSDHNELYNHLKSTYDCLRLVSIYEYVGDANPRNLFFDLDGDLVTFSKQHDVFIDELTRFVNWFFDIQEGVQQKPYVVKAPFADKYSAHVIYPYIQFENYIEQGRILPLLLNSLYALRWNDSTQTYEFNPPIPTDYYDVHNEQENRSTSKLSDQFGVNNVVDREVYRSNQNLRTPYSCKLRRGQYAFSTIMTPALNNWNIENFDERCLFIGYCENQRMNTSGLDDILTKKQIRQVIDTFGYVGLKSSRIPSILTPTSIKNYSNCQSHFKPQLTNRFLDMTLYYRHFGRSLDPKFRNSTKQSLINAGLQMKDIQSLDEIKLKELSEKQIIDLSNVTDVQLLSSCLFWIHTKRSDDFYSWWRISGITARFMMNQTSMFATNEILRAFLDWSKTSNKFNADENFHEIVKALERAMTQQSLPLLQTLFYIVEFDNPFIVFKWPEIELEVEADNKVSSHFNGTSSSAVDSKIGEPENGTALEGSLFLMNTSSLKELAEEKDAEEKLERLCREREFLQKFEDNN